MPPVTENSHWEGMSAAAALASTGNLDMVPGVGIILMHTRSSIPAINHAELALSSDNIAGNEADLHCWHQTVDKSPSMIL